MAVAEALASRRPEGTGISNKKRHAEGSDLPAPAAHREAVGELVHRLMSG